ncbi:MAG: HlyD family efflux transporter periplasmic adaptor subunit [Betaproteobacteria bacterium]|nr:HlyD family efflux transporter periplasmic adaptor subunit [Betaproteobacteria bacterium]
METSGAKAVHIKPVLAATTRHPIKAARLLYTPPGAILRGPIYMVFVVTFVGLFYSFWGTKDEIVDAPFRLERESSTTQAIGGGLVAEISVKEGQIVNIGTPLIDVQERTRATSSPEQEFLNQQKTLAQNRLGQLRLELDDIKTNIGTQRIVLGSRVEQVTEQLNASMRGLDRRKNQLDLARKQFERKKTLYNDRDITLPEFEDAQQRLNEAERAVDDANSEILTIKLALSTAKAELSKYADFKTREKVEKSIAQAEEEIAGYDKKIKDSQNLVEGLKYDTSIAKYSSKVKGQITRVFVSPGQLVSAGVPLVTVIPEGAPLEARVVIRNDRIGLLKRLQDVKIKYFTFPFQEYGIAAGKIKSISTVPSELRGEESMYVVTVALERETVARRDSKPVPLGVGIAGVAEVKVGEKRLIELLFSPVSKFLTPKEV